MTGSILVVDDHADTGAALVKMMRMQGLHALFAASGTQALECLAARTPDLVLLDVMMPGTDGLAVLRVIRSEPRLARVPVVVYTAISDPEFKTYALREGATDYWVKGAFEYGDFPRMLAAHLPTLLPPPAPPESGPSHCAR